MSAPTTARAAAPVPAPVTVPVPVPTSWSPPAAVRGTVVVLPGRGETPAHYARLGRRLSADGYRVEVLPDTPEDADGVAASWAALGADGRLAPAPVVAVAVDASAAAVVEALAAGGVTPHALVVAGAALGRADVAAPTPVADAVAARTSCPVHRAVWADHGDAALDALRRTTAATRRWTARPDVVVDVPALVLHGDDDAITPVGDVLDAVRHWPRARVVTVRAGVHDVLNDAAHRSVAAELVRFLEALRDPRDPGRAALVVRSDRLDAPTDTRTPAAGGPS